MRIVVTRLTAFVLDRIVLGNTLLLILLAAPFVNPSRKAIHDLAASSVVAGVGRKDAASPGHRQPRRAAA